MFAALFCAFVAAPQITDVAFIGFSSNEAVAAWRVKYQDQHAPGITDTYRLIHVVETKTQHLLGRFRDSVITRNGPRQSPRALAAKNPWWHSAEPRRQWLALFKQGDFKKVPMGNGTDFLSTDNEDVRIQFDGDTEATISREDQDFFIQAAKGKTLGASLMARLFDASLYPLGHIREEVENASTHLRMKLTFYVSPSGLAVAYYATITSPQRSLPRFVPAVTQLPGTPLNTTTMGALGFAGHTLVQAEEIFGELNPETRTVYNMLIGRGW